MEGISVEVKSPEEIEEGISSIQTVTWDPFTVFPKEIYVAIFDKLDSHVDKTNFMNAHVKWYELFKDKRTLFLFQDVFKEINKADDEYLITEPETGSFRLICRDWDIAVQNYFQNHESNFNLDGFESKGRFKIRKEVFKELRGGGRRAGRVALESHFTWVDGEDLEKDLKMFSVTHPPSRNPFLSRKICLFLPSLNEADFERYVTAVDALLEIYGSHIWHCTLSTDLDLQNCRRMAKWLSQMPELKTLVMIHEVVDGREWGLDVEEFWEMDLLLPEMNKIVVLKSEGLPPLVFNKFFGHLKCLEKIQFRNSEAVLENFDLDDLPPTKFILLDHIRETLKEVVFIIEDLQDFFDILANCGSFPNLKRLSIKLELGEITNAYLEGYQWSEASEILEKKFPGLEDLSMRLLKAVPLKERLNLPKLKKLLIALPHWTSLDFLLPCKALEEIKINLEHLNLAVREIDIRFQRPRLWTEELIELEEEETEYNVDLKTLWKSNVWDEFPKLRGVDVEVCEDKYWRDYYRYRRTGEMRKSRVFNHSVQSDESSEESSDSSNETSDSDE